MEEIKVAITLDTNGYEAGLAKVSQLNDAAIAKFAKTWRGFEASTSQVMINGVQAGSIAGFLDKYAINLQNAAAAQNTLAKSATNVTATLQQNTAGLQQAGQAATQLPSRLLGISNAFGVASVATRNYSENLREASHAFIQAVPGVQGLERVLGTFGVTLRGLATVGGLTAVFGSMALGIKHAADFESAFNQVRRTVQFAGDESTTSAQKFEALAKSIQHISTDTGIATTTLAKIAAEAGHLGLRSVQDISKFTETIGKLSVVTGMSGQGLALSFSRLALQMDESLTNADRMSSTLVELANNSRASEAQILDMATTIAGMGKFMGMTTAQVLSLSAAFASIGVQPMAINRLMFDMTRAVREQTGMLELFAKVAGRTNEEFSKLFEADAAQAMAAFFQGMAKHGSQATVILQKLNLDSQITAKSMIQLANATGEFDKNQTLLVEKLKIGVKAWDDNIAANKEFREAVQDTWSQLGILKTRVEEALVKAFEGALPVIKSVIQAFSTFVQFLNEHPEILKWTGWIIGLIAAFTALKVLLAGFGLLWAGLVGGLSMVFGGLSSVITGIAGLIRIIPILTAALGPLALAIGPVGWVAIGLAAVGAAMIAFVKYTEMGAKAWERFKGLFTGGAAEAKEAAVHMEDAIGQATQHVRTGAERNAKAVVDASKKGVDALNLLSDTEAKALQSRLAVRTASFQNEMSIMDAKRSAAVSLGAMTEREALADMENVFAKRKRMAELDRADQIRLADKDLNTKKEHIEAAELKFKASMAEIVRARIENSVKLEMLNRKEFEDYSKSLLQQVDAANTAYQAIGDLRQQLSVQTADLGLTDAERTLKGFQDQYIATLKQLADIKDEAVVGSQRYEAAVRGEAEAQALLNKRIEDFLTKGAKDSARELVILAQSIGLTRDEAAKVAAAWTLAGKAYKDLSPAQREQADLFAKSAEQARQFRLAIEEATLAQELFWAGVTQNEAFRLASQIKAIELEEQNLDKQIAAYNKLNNSRQIQEQKTAQLMRERGETERDFFKFSIGITRKYMADQDTLWQGFERMLVNTFSNIQRSLGDVFFNVFTGQTVKLKDVFKDLLNSILRDLASFMASAAVKGFLAFLTNVLSGQSVGDSATGALQSLIGTPSNTAQNSSTSSLTSVGGAAVSLISQAINALRGNQQNQGDGSSSLQNATQEELAFIFDAQGDVGTTYGEYVYLSSGGRVPGYGRGDTVPAMLEPGEFVIRREVAQQLGPTLEQLNGIGGPTMRDGRLHFAAGGMVPGSITTEALLQAILVAINRQTATTQTIAQNTGQSSTTLTVIAKQEGAASVPQWIAPSGTNAQPSGFESFLNTGTLQTGLRAVGSGASAFGFRGVGQTAVGLAGIASLIQGIQQDRPALIASGGLTTASALAGLLANPVIAQALGLTPSQVASASLLSQGFAAGTGVLGLVQSLERGDELGAAAGGVQTLASLANILSSKTAAGMFGYGTGSGTLGGAFGAAGGALGAVGGGLTLYQGIKNEDPAQIAMGAYGTVTGTYSTLSAIAPGTFTPLSTLAADALIALAPEVAASLGITGSAGAAAAASAATASASTIPVATGATAAAAADVALGGTVAGVGAAGAAGGISAATLGATGVGLAMAAVLLLDNLGVFERWGQHTPTAGEISTRAGNFGINAFHNLLREQTDLKGLVELMNTPFGPHGEVLIGSALPFGGQGWEPDKIGEGQPAVPAGPLWMQALGALYTPELVNAGQGMPWVEQFVRGLDITYGQTGAATVPDKEAVWKLQSQLAMALPNLPAYAGIKAAVAPGGDLWQAEQTRQSAYVQWLRALPVETWTNASGMLVTAPMTNTYDPYTDTVTTEDGRRFLLAHQTIADYSINPYSYNSYIPPGYGGQSFSDPSLNLTGGEGGMAEGGWVQPNAYGMAGGGWVAAHPPRTWEGLPSGPIRYLTESQFLQESRGLSVEDFNRILTSSATLLPPGYYERVQAPPNSTDTVPAMLTPGEFVVPRDVAAQNRGLLETMTGGGIDPNLKEWEWSMNGRVHPAGWLSGPWGNAVGWNPLHQGTPWPEGLRVSPQMAAMFKQSGIEVPAGTPTRGGATSATGATKMTPVRTPTAVRSAPTSSSRWTEGGINITVIINGDVSDPREIARKSATAIRDELRRIEPRYSRAGNKTQG